MEQFPGNSQRQRPSRERPEPKKVEKIVEGRVARRKKPLGKRLKEVFVGGDAGSVWEFVALDVLLPAAKDMFVDAVREGAERMVFGESRGYRRGGRHPGDRSYVSYNRYSSGRSSQRDDRNDRPQMSRRGRSSHDFDEIILQTRVEADEVIDRLFDLVSKYETATVADLYDLVGIQGNYTDDKWGWSDIRGAGVTRVRNGYLLDLPRPEPLD